MGFYTMSFSLAHIMSANIGFEVIDNFGYQTNWLVMGTLGLFAAACAIWVMKMVREE
jgi:predicted MFS family arabinose efflux permease